MHVRSGVPAAVRERRRGDGREDARGPHVRARGRPECARVHAAVQPRRGVRVPEAQGAGDSQHRLDRRVHRAEAPR